MEHVTRIPFPEPVAGLARDHFEIEPTQIIKSIRGLLGSLLAFAPKACGILISSQMGGVILTYPDGRLASSYLSWRDQRTVQKHPSCSGSYIDAIYQELGEDEIRKMGNELRAGSPIALLYWLSQHKRLSLGIEALSLGDYVVRNLCASNKTATDPTLALGLLDLKPRTWNFNAFKALGLQSVVWPELSAVWKVAGYAEINGSKVPCYPAIGDHQAALAGVRLASLDLSINISTGSQISILTDNFEPGDYQTRPYLDDRYLNTITHLPAGRSLDVLVKLVTELAVLQGANLGDPWPIIIQAVNSCTSSELLTQLTFFEGPLGKMGSITNITTENLTVGALFRSALNDMACNYASCATKLSPDHAWQQIVFSGGIAQKLPMLRQLILEKLPCGMRLCSSAEDTLQGLLEVSLVISGRAENLQDTDRLTAGVQTEIDIESTNH